MSILQKVFEVKPENKIETEIKKDIYAFEMVAGGIDELRASIKYAEKEFKNTTDYTFEYTLIDFENFIEKYKIVN